LSGRGHKSPLVDDFERAKVEFAQLHNNNNFIHQFRASLDELLKKFSDEKLDRLFKIDDKPVAGENEFLEFRHMLEDEVALKLRNLCANEVEHFKQLVAITSSIFDEIHFFDNFESSGSKESKEDAFKILKGSLTKTQSFLNRKSVTSVEEKFPIYDISVLNLNEIKFLCQFFALDLTGISASTDFKSKLESVLPFVTKNQIRDPVCPTESEEKTCR
jgi:hypothetical protein